MLTLARAEFALTAIVHFLFVMVTLGLVTLVAVAQTRWVATGRPVYERMTRYWGRLYVVNYAVGIAVGLVMEFQFGLNWSGLSRLTGDVFGAPLAMETLVAFFLESTFLGMWIFGWGRLRRGAHLALIWLVALTAYLSAFWVMVANSFLQHPVGYDIDAAGRARLTDFGALLVNPNLGFALAHALSAALLAGGLLMAGISARHLLRRTREYEFYRRSIRMGLVTAFLGTFLVVGFGFAQFSYLDNQPAKLATGARAAEIQAQMVAEHGPGDYIPSLAVPASLGVMIQIGMVLFLFTAALLPLLTRDWLLRVRLLRPVLWLVVAAVPLPFLGAILGWIVREIGRQPWAVYGLLKTEDAVSDLPRGAMLASLLGFGTLVVLLAVVDWWLLARLSRRGPGAEFLPVPDADLDDIEHLDDPEHLDDIDDDRRGGPASGAAPTGSDRHAPRGAAGPAGRSPFAPTGA